MDPRMDWVSLEVQELLQERCLPESEVNNPETLTSLIGKPLRCLFVCLFLRFLASPTNLYLLVRGGHAGLGLGR